MMLNDWIYEINYQMFHIFWDCGGMASPGYDTGSYTRIQKTKML